MYKVILFSLTLSLSSILGIRLSAQTDSQANTKDSPDAGFTFLGGIGPAVPIGTFGDERQSGFDLNTALDYRFDNGLMVRGMFDFSTFSFDVGAITQAVGSETYTVGGSNNLISLLVSGGYYVPFGRFSAYTFAGLGSSFISKPVVDINELQNIVDTNLEVTPYFSHVLGTGVDFALNPNKVDDDAEKKSTLYLLYFEAFYTRIPTITNISAHHFNLVSFNIGIKTKM